MRPIASPNEFLQKPFSLKMLYACWAIFILLGVAPKR